MITVGKENSTSIDGNGIFMANSLHYVDLPLHENSLCWLKI